VHAPPRSLRPRLLTAIAIVALVAPGAVLAGAIARHGVDVPYWDEWDLAPVAERALSGQLRLPEVVSWHNDHRFIVQRLGVAVQALAWRWDARTGMWASFALAALAAALLTRTVQKTVPGERWQQIGLAAIIAAFLFSPAQWDNWLMGIQFAFFVPLFAVSGGLALGWSRPAVRWAGTATLCLLATSSSSVGLLTWFAVLPAITGQAISVDRQRLSSGAAWLALTAAVFAGYLHDFPGGAGALTALTPGGPLLATADFTLCLLGAPLAHGTAFDPIAVARLCGAVLVGAYVLAAAVVWRRRQQVPSRDPATPWLALGGFGLASASLVALGRAAGGLEQSLESRYATLVTALPAALIPLLAIAAARAGRRRTATSRADEPGTERSSSAAVALAAGTIGALLALHVISAAAGLDRMAAIGRERQAARAALHYSQVVDDPGPMIRLFPSVETVRVRVRRLEELGQLDLRLATTAGLRESSPAPGSVSGRVESCAVDRDGRIVLSGWAAFDDRREAAHLVGVAARAPGSPDTLMSYAVPDEASPSREYLWRIRPYLRHASWVAHIPPGALPAGASSLTVWVLDADTGRAHQLSGQWSLTCR